MAERTDVDALADQIFLAVKEYLDRTVTKRCQELEARIKVLELLDERRAKSVTKFVRDEHGEIQRSIRGED